MPPRHTRAADPTLRALLVRVLEAGEALCAASQTYHELLDRVPPEHTLGLTAEVNGVEDYDVNELIDKLADLMGVPDDADTRRTVPTLQAARERLEAKDRIIAGELADVVERLTGVVSSKLTPVLADVERRALADFTRASARPS